MGSLIAMAHCHDFGRFWEDPAGTGPDTTPPVFSGIGAVIPAGTTKLKLQWLHAVDNVTQPGAMIYEIYESTTAGGEVYSAPAYTVVGFNEHLVTGVSVNSARYYVVRARDAAGNKETNLAEKSAATFAAGDTWTAITNVPAPSSGRAPARSVGHPNGYIYIMGGGNCGYGTFYTNNDRYDPVTDTYMALANMPGTIDSDPALGMNGKLYLNPGGIFTEYDPSLDSYSVKAAMPIFMTCGYATVGAANGKVYVFGGQAAGCLGYTNTVQAYNPLGDSWQVLTSSPFAPAQNGYQIASFRDKIYIFGGFNGSYLTTAWMYDTISDITFPRATIPGPAPANNFAVTAANDKIYIIGPGFNYEYDPVTDSYVSRATFPMGSGYNVRGAIANNGKIYTFGGDNGGCAVQNSYEYTPP
jgi:hypothetical protein